MYQINQRPAKRRLMKFYDVALAKGVHDKVLTYDFFRFVRGAHVFFDTTVLVSASVQGHPHYAQAGPVLVLSRKNSKFHISSAA